MGEEQDLSHLFHLVRDRSRIQDLAFELLDLLRATRDIRGADSGNGNPYELLAGTAFSLWRAVFLAESASGWDAVLGDAETFLEKLIRDNIINYADDWRNRKWLFRYYLGNARFRLTAFAGIYTEFAPRLESYGLVRQGEVAAAPAFEMWEAHANALAEAIEFLREKSGNRSGMQRWTKHRR